MTRWTAQPNGPDAFQSLNAVFDLTGQRITNDRISDVIYVTAGQTGYYIKRYTAAGKGLRRWLGRSRLRGEWENLQRFEQWGLPAACIVAYGAEKRGPFFKRGAAITKELPNTSDLASLATNSDQRLQDSAWVQAISHQLAQAARVMHANRFAHGDFKWRNILISNDGAPQIYLIDCPDGKRWSPPFLQYRKNKDIACLDKVARQVLSQTQRLRFYLDYLGKKKLSKKDKQNLRHILNFFRGRE